MTEKPTYEELEQRIKEMENQVAGKVSPQTDEKAQITATPPEEDTGVDVPRRILVRKLS